MSSSVKLDSSKPLIELFVKCSSVDKSEKGCCPISQKWFMVFFTMVKHNIIDFKLTSVNLDNLPPNYAKLNVGRRFPVVVVLQGQHPQTGENLTDRVFDNDDEIEKLMEYFNCPGMQPASSAFKVTANLYRNFNTFLVTDSPDLLLKDLHSLDVFLLSRDVPYLSGYDLSYVDCHVMPKLQHIRVVCEAYKSNFSIPMQLQHLWKYFDTMYSTEAFLVSCPSDRDILSHYYEKVHPRPSHQTPLTLIDAHKTLTIPKSNLHSAS